MKDGFKNWKRGLKLKDGFRDDHISNRGDHGTWNFIMSYGKFAFTEKSWKRTSPSYKPVINNRKISLTGFQVLCLASLMKKDFILLWCWNLFKFCRWKLSNCQ